MNKFLDVLKFSLKKDTEKYFEEVDVKEVLYDKKTSSMIFNIISNHIVPYIYIKDAEEEILKEIKNSDLYNVKININYDLDSNYDLNYILNICKPDFVKELSFTDKIMSHMLESSKFIVEDEKNVRVSIINNSIISNKIVGLKKYLNDTLHNRFNREANILIDNIDDNDKIESDNDSVYENIYKHNTVITNDINKVEISNENSSDKKYNISKRSLEFYDDPVFPFGKIKISNTKYIDIKDAKKDMKDVTIKGIIVSIDIRDIKDNKSIFSYCIKDKTGIILVQIFKPTSMKEVANKHLKIGMMVSISGDIKYDDYKYVEDYIVDKVKRIEVINKSNAIEIKGKDDSYYLFPSLREDTSSEKRVELHLHTKTSNNDGIGAIEEYIESARRFGMKAMAITDHGSVNSLADAYTYIKKNKINDLKIINGLEGYLVDDTKDLIVGEKFDASQIKNIIILNVVTTGFNYENDEIIKIEAIKLKNLIKTDDFIKFVKNRKPLSYEVQKRTNIFVNDLKNEKDISEVIKQFIDFSKDENGEKILFASFNANFTYHILKKYISYDISILDVETLSRFIIKDLTRFKKDTILNKLKIKSEGTDREVEKTHKIFTGLVNFAIKNDYKDVDSKSIIKSILDKFDTSDDYIKKLPYYHIILLAKNDVGRVNLYKLVSDSYIHYFGGGKRMGKPRIPRSLLDEYREGLLVGSACIAGELMSACRNFESDETLEKIANYYDYLEIQPHMNNSFLLKKEPDKFKSEEDLIALNKRIIRLGERLNKLVVATTDCHYLDKEDKIFREIVQHGFMFKKVNYDKDGNIKKELIEDTEESGNEYLYFRTTDEMLAEFSYLSSDKAYEVVIKNTNIINDMIEDIIPLRLDKCTPVKENSDEILHDLCYSNMRKIFGDNPPEIVKNRLDRELTMIINSGYSALYLFAKDDIDCSMKLGYPVGSRGSVGSSLAARLSGISEVDPLPPYYICDNCKKVIFDNEYLNQTGFDMEDKLCPNCNTLMRKDGVNIPFETFLGIEGGKPKEPDIDLNFCSEVQSKVHDFTLELFGEKNTFKAGTVGTVARKTARSYVETYMKDSETILNETKLNYYVSKIIGCKNNTSQHPGGMIVVPRGEYIYTFTPIQLAIDDEGDEAITTHYDYHKLEENLLKLDLLGQKTPSTIKMLGDVTGIDPMTVPFYEKEVLDLFSTTDSLGIKKEDISGTELGILTIPEFGTDVAIKMCLEAKPKSVADLIRVSGLAHGTNVWQNNIRDLVLNDTCSLKDAVCCRDDIMIYLIEKGIDDSIAFEIMESVRKGKSIPNAYIELLKNHNVPDWYIESCNKIEYMFPKAHAAAYVIAALRIAYFKVHHKAEYYATYFTIRKDGFFYNLMMQDKEKIHYEIQTIKDEYKKRKSFKYKKSVDGNEEYSKNDNTGLADYSSMKDKKLDSIYHCFRICEEMLQRGVEFEPIDIYKARAKEFVVIKDNKIMPALMSINGLGEKAAIKMEGVVKEAIDTNTPFTCIEDFKKRTGVSKNILDSMIELNIIDLPSKGAMYDTKNEFEETNELLELINND